MSFRFFYKRQQAIAFFGNLCWAACEGIRFFARLLQPFVEIILLTLGFFGAAAPGITLIGNGVEAAAAGFAFGLQTIAGQALFGKNCPRLGKNGPLQRGILARLCGIGRCGQLGSAA